MNSLSRLSGFLAGCLLQCIPLFLQAQAPAQPSEAIPSESVGPSEPIPSTLSPSNPSIEGNPHSSGQPRPSAQSPASINHVSDILGFWFGFLPGPGFFPEHKMPLWFASTPEMDRQIYDRFFQDVLKAQQGEYNDWRETPQGRLALILLLDQIPRHIYRGKPQAFMSDRMARALVLEGIKKGDDRRLYPVERAFFYLPLEHSENVDLQNLSVASYRRLLADSPESIRLQMEDFLQSAVMHQQQIMRFGRFPARNAILGRKSIPEEAIFLMQGRRY